MGRDREQDLRVVFQTQVFVRVTGVSVLDEIALERSVHLLSEWIDLWVPTQTDCVEFCLDIVVPLNEKNAGLFKLIVFNLKFLRKTFSLYYLLNSRIIFIRSFTLN